MNCCTRNQYVFFRTFWESCVQTAIAHIFVQLFLHLHDRYETLPPWMQAMGNRGTGLLGIGEH